MKRRLSLAFVSLLGCGTANSEFETPTEIETEAAETVAETSDSLALLLTGRVMAARGNGGPAQTFGPGIYLANAGEMAEVGNDQIRTLIVGPAMRVRACQHEQGPWNNCHNYENLGGGNKTFSVGAGISRLEVRALVVGYHDSNFSGVAQGFEIGRHETVKNNLSIVGNDQISSLRLAPGLSARLCSDNPETTVGGVCTTFTSSASALPVALNNTGSWLEVRPATVAYQNAHFSGIDQRFGAGVFTASQLSIVGNDTISSLLVNEGVSARLCSDNPNTTTGGNCGRFTKSSLALGAPLDNNGSWLSNSHTVILQPLNDVEFGPSAVTLRGYAIDPEDGEIPGARLRWYSSRDGFLGTGKVLDVNLSTDDAECGRSAEHVIRLIATDSVGNQTMTTRTYRIQGVC